MFEQGKNYDKNDTTDTSDTTDTNDTSDTNLIGCPLRMLCHQGSLGQWQIIVIRSSKNQPPTWEVGFWKGNLPGRCPDAEFVAVGIGELRPFAPGFSTQLFRKSDTTSFEHRTRFFDIVGMQDVAGEASFVAATLAAQPKHDMGLCSGRSYFEPALGFAHGLVIDLLKAERVDIEVESFVLVADPYTDGADFREHKYLLFVDHSIFNDSSYRTKIQVYERRRPIFSPGGVPLLLFRLFLPQRACWQQRLILAALSRRITLPRRACCRC